MKTQSHFQANTRVVLSADELRQYYRFSITDCEVKENDITVRLELMYVLKGTKLVPPAKGNTIGKPCSIKSGRISLGVLLDQGVITVDQLPALIKYARLFVRWSRENTAYSLNRKSRVFILAQPGSTVEADTIVFTDATSGNSTVGMINLEFTGKWDIVSRDVDGVNFSSSAVTCTQTSRDLLGQFLSEAEEDEAEVALF